MIITYLAARSAEDLKSQVRIISCISSGHRHRYIHVNVHVWDRFRETYG